MKIFFIKKLRSTERHTKNFSHADGYDGRTQYTFFVSHKNVVVISLFFWVIFVFD